LAVTPGVHLLYWIATAMSVTGVILHWVALRDRPDSYAGLSRWQKVAAEIRRHPRLRSAQLMCSAIGLALYLSGALILTLGN
jgi:hypothetical protein